MALVARTPLGGLRSWKGRRHGANDGPEDLGASGLRQLFLSTGQLLLAGMRHCYVLCHDLGRYIGRLSGLIDFFVQQAESLALKATGDAQAYV